MGAKFKAVIIVAGFLVNHFGMRISLVCVVVVTLFFLPATIVFGGEKKQETDIDKSPMRIQVASKYNDERITGSCDPYARDTKAEKIDCEFFHLRFEPPDLDYNIVTALSEEFKITVEEVKKKQRYYEDLFFNTRGRDIINNLCSSSTKSKYKKMILDPEVGPKNKLYYQKIFAACSSPGNGSELFKLILQKIRGECKLNFEQLLLKFKKVDKGHWLARDEIGIPYTKVLKIYELTRSKYSDMFWDLTITYVPTAGSDVEPEKKIYKMPHHWPYSMDYEPPCDFINFDMDTPNPFRCN